MLRPLSTAILIVAVGAIVAACSPATRYEVLTFFFTGVPPLEEQMAKTLPGDGTGKTEGLQPATASLSSAEKVALKKAEILQKRKLRLLRAVRWTHGPYAAAECNRCHALSASLGLGARAGGAKKGAMNMSSVGGRLLAPAEELCLGCHETKSVQAADKRKLRLHGPVASGLCIGCHNPHQSPRRYMLLGKDTVDLCTQCHEKDGLRQRTAAHAKATKLDCLACHNPHMGRTAMILKADYDERRQP